MAGFDCAGGAGVGAAALVAQALRACGYSNVYSGVPSALFCCEPLVVRQHEYERAARFDDGTERGCERVRVYVCMDYEPDAAGTAAAVCRDLANADWAAVHEWATAQYGEEAVRIVAVSAGAPDDLGRDSSGRWVRAIDLLCTVVRPSGDEE